MTQKTTSPPATPKVNQSKQSSSGSGRNFFASIFGSATESEVMYDYDTPGSKATPQKVSKRPSPEFKTESPKVTTTKATQTPIATKAAVSTQVSKSKTKMQGTTTSKKSDTPSFLDSLF